MQSTFNHGLTISVISAVFFVQLVFSASVCAEPTVRERLDLIGSINGDSPPTEIQRLISLLEDRSQVPQPCFVPESLTVGKVAANRLANLKGVPKVQEIALAHIRRESTSPRLFSSLVRAVDISSLSEKQCAAFQELCVSKGKEFQAEFLQYLGSLPRPFGDCFDLSISQGLASKDCVVPACTAILSRKGRNILWNKRLIDLCEFPIEGRIAAAPDFQVQVDFRCVVMRALRKNGFPSSDVLEFLRDFDPGTDTELYFQLLATRFALGSDVDAINELVMAIESERHRDVAAKVIVEDVHIPRHLKPRIFASAVNNNDLASLRLSRLLIEQFQPVDFEKTEKLELFSTLSRSRNGAADFRAWQNSSDESD